MATMSDTQGPSDTIGPVLVTYSPNRTWGYVAAASLLFVLTFLALALLDIGPFTPVLPVILAIIVVPVSFGCIAELFRPSYQVGHYGVAVYRRGHWVAYPWDDVAAIWLTTTVTYHEATQSTAQYHSCRLAFEDGRRLRLDGLSEEFLGWLAGQVYQSILPRVQAAWDVGQPIRFGAVSLSRTGIHSGRRVLPWLAVASVKAERNESDIVVRERGRSVPWMELAGDTIPNLAVFFHLIQTNIREWND